MNLLSAWLDFWSKVINPDLPKNPWGNCYFCSDRISLWTEPQFYVLINPSHKKVTTCYFCFKQHESKISNDVIEYVNTANSTPKEVEVAVSPSLVRKLKIR